jgi:hypothetical protein
MMRAKGRRRRKMRRVRVVLMRKTAGKKNHWWVP